MEIIFHAHHANVSDRTRKRAEAAVRRLGQRMSRAIDAIIRFEQDGPVKRVEIVLHAPGKRSLVARAEGQFYGPVLTAAVERLTRQIKTLRDSRRSAQRAPAAGKAAGA